MMNGCASCCNVCEERNIALNSGESKFILKEEQLPYMGHIFSPDGLRPDPAKIKAITDMPSPDGPAATRRFLGMVNYLAKFIPTLSGPMSSIATSNQQGRVELEPIL